MCGFAGFLSSAWFGDAASLRLKAMTNAIAHRGPDFEGQWMPDAASTIKHHHLSIIEQVAQGRA